MHAEQTSSKSKPFFALGYHSQPAGRLRSTRQPVASPVDAACRHRRRITVRADRGRAWHSGPRRLLRPGPLRAAACLRTQMNGGDSPGRLLLSRRTPPPHAPQAPAAPALGVGIVDEVRGARHADTRLRISPESAAPCFAAVRDARSSASAPVDGTLVLLIFFLLVLLVSVFSCAH